MSDTLTVERDVEYSSDLESGDESEVESSQSDDDDTRNITATLTDHDSPTADSGPGASPPSPSSKQSPSKHSPSPFPSKCSRRSSSKSSSDSVPPEKLLRRAHRRIHKLLKSSPVFGPSSCDIAALDDFVRCIPLARIVFGDFHWRVARSHADLGLAYLDLFSLPVQSHDHASTARSLLTQGVHLSENPHEKAGILESFLITYYTLGRSAARLDKDADAEKALLKAEKIHQEFGKLSSVSSEALREWEVKIALALARLFTKRKNFTSAEEEFTRCLDLMRKVSETEEDVALVPVLLDLARMKQSVGTATQIEASIDVFARAHAINIAVYPDDDHLATARSALSLGQAYAALDSDESHCSGEAYLRKAVDAFSVVLGPAHEDTQDALNMFAKLLIRMTKTSEAVAVIKRKIRGRFEAEGGEFSEAMAADHQLLGSLHLANGDLDLATSHLKKCHEIQRIALGPNHRKTRGTASQISAISQTNDRWR